MSTFINQQKSWRKVLGWLSSTSIIGIFSSRVTRSFSSSVNSKEARYTPLRIEKKETKLHRAFITSSFQSLSLKAQSHFQLSVESHPGLHWFCFTSLCDWSIPQQIRCKTKTNHDLVARFCPHFKQFGCFHFEFSIAPKGILWSNFGFGFTTINRKVSTLAIKQSLSRKSKNVWDYKRFKTFGSQSWSESRDVYSAKKHTSWRCPRTNQSIFLRCHGRDSSRNERSYYSVQMQCDRWIELSSFCSMSCRDCFMTMRWYIAHFKGR